MTFSYRINTSWPGLIFIIFWLTGNVVTFTLTFLKISNSQIYAYVFYLLKFFLCLSRGAASALNFNCALILFPVCHNIINILRSCCSSACKDLKKPKALYRQLDNNIFFHKLVAYAICFWTFLHVLGHTFNLENFISTMENPKDKISKLLVNLTLTQDSHPPIPIQNTKTNPMYELIVMLAGWTGLGTTVIVVIILASSLQNIRKNFHEAFIYLHHLFILFFVFIILHGFGGAVSEQSNTDTHDPIICMDKPNEWSFQPGNLTQCPLPTFQPHEAETWKWVLPGLILYSLELLIKIIHRFIPVQVVQVIEHEEKVVEVRMRKAFFSSYPGQYISIMCPSISIFQWHPFTLTNAPEDDYFSVHIKICGDWTQKFHQKLISSQKNKKKLRLSVSGPFGTCCMDIWKYKVNLLVGGGIGVAPFASVLKHVWYTHNSIMAFDKMESSNNHSGNYTEQKKNEIKRKKLEILRRKLGMEKIVFVWLCRGKSFLWFNKLLSHIESSLEQSGLNEFLEINIYWTSGWKYEMHQLMSSSINERLDCMTNLTSKTYIGRPNWSLLFQSLVSQYQSEDIGVFFCGPKQVAKQLRGTCSSYSRLNPFKKPRFIFHKEKF